jgi:hypothetical protein
MLDIQGGVCDLRISTRPTPSAAEETAEQSDIGPVDTFCR